MLLQELTGFLESLAPLSLQEDYDNAGLITGHPGQEVSKAIISLDCTEAVIEEAVSEGAEMVIAHHPVVFRGLKKLTESTYVERTVLSAIRNNIAIYAIHTNLDHVPGGVNAKICEKLGLRETRILSPKTGMLKKLVTFCPHAQAEALRAGLFEAGAGHIGNYDQCSYNLEGYGTFRAGPGTQPFAGGQGRQHREPETRIETIYPVFLENKLLAALFRLHPYEEPAYDIYPLANTWGQAGAGMIGTLPEEVPLRHFLEEVKGKMRTGCIRYTRPVKETVQRIAVCGGAGGFLLRDAVRVEADVFITADYKYHEFFDADGKIVIADIGHYESEQFTGELLRENISKQFPNFAALLTKVNTNPVNYL
ncbi:dinuclear metal center YbgI/SA1388 family protein [Anseongella ginsenosidimutans]|uniref:GTP cyclohydrolase 1 type 2 homolog n=1 Tax=Anseongella ginsenosidimutans TaxID=496056 RepID=A0A4R3KZJ5_9SPHI|nr:Nif3-like dinuclear metal center hexameric protein [Anseongella ginsenosidimutans]QEC51264.1 Nif3-like dinuclear metal center hexameric protein [Anseongella ginsenosidimutans]TCS90050.1 dinuclear metal center YbgI/SA1388 family protein [Anseongella ginsenosidimutans]